MLVSYPLWGIDKRGESIYPAAKWSAIMAGVLSLPEPLFLINHIKGGAKRRLLCLTAICSVNENCCMRSQKQVKIYDGLATQPLTAVDFVSYEINF
jgi:hypothetical protein